MEVMKSVLCKVWALESSPRKKEKKKKKKQGYGLILYSLPKLPEWWNNSLFWRAENDKLIYCDLSQCAKDKSDFFGQKEAKSILWLEFSQENLSNWNIVLYMKLKLHRIYKEMFCGQL